MGKRALELPSFDDKPPPEPLWTRDRWNADESWALLDDQVSEKDEDRAYARNAVKNVGAPRFEDQEIDRLRSLGYVESLKEQGRALVQAGSTQRPESLINSTSRSEA